MKSEVEINFSLVEVSGFLGGMGKGRSVGSLITGRGGGRWLQNGRGGGHLKFYPYEKGGGGGLAILNWGHKKFWGSFYEVTC